MILTTRFVFLPIVCAGLLMTAKTIGDLQLPPPYATPSADNRATVIPRPANASLHVPNSFKIEEWAGGFALPRFMLLGQHGEILVADSAEGAGAIYVFPNANPSARKKLIGGLTRPYGLALWKQYLYVGEPESVSRYPYDTSNFTAGKREEVISLKGFTQDHWTRSLLFDRSGQKLYVGVGSGANVELGEDPRRAAINRYNPDGSSHEIFASGTRNPIGLHWYPNSDTLWAAIQERDELGDNLVPDYFTHIPDGGFYGWPYSYIGNHEDPRIKPQRPDLVNKAIVPDVLFKSHVAVLDFTFYTGNQFPAEYRGGAFLAFHGSWNRSHRDGYEVAFVPFKNGQPTADAQDFVTGWMLSPTEKDVWGRPVAVLQINDGSLLISDDGAKKIWRVSYGQNH